MRIVSCDAAFRAMQLRLISTLFTMASYRQLPIFIFTTSLATSLASSCRSASPGVFFSQRLPAPGSRLHCLDPPLHAAVSLGFAQKCLFLEGFAGGRPLLLPACHARPLEACDASFRLISIAMESIESSGWTWRRCLCMNRLFCRPAGCERTDHGSEAGWGLACVLRPSESGLSRPAGWERKGDQGGMGPCMCVSRRIRN